MRISDWSSDVCSSDLVLHRAPEGPGARRQRADPAVRLRRLRDLADPVVLGHGRQGLAGARRRVRGRQHPRRWRIRPALAPGRAEGKAAQGLRGLRRRSEEHTSELQSLMRISYAVFCLKKKNNTTSIKTENI